MRKLEEEEKFSLNKQKICDQNEKYKNEILDFKEGNKSIEGLTTKSQKLEQKVLADSNQNSPNQGEQRKNIRASSKINLERSKSREIFK